MRVRKSVWSLGPDDPVIVWYRRAVEVMIERPTADPTSWRYLAAIHGVPPGISTPSGAADIWDRCQHQNWFFLPWHRAYLASFEAIVAQTIADLGGPSDWALPYWNYSEDVAINPNARLMPRAFFDRRLPDGSRNALWSRRAAVQNGDFGLGDTIVSLAALDQPLFSRSRSGATFGFGGPNTAFNPGTGNGAVEAIPHNRIHTQIGGFGGFMTDPATAALDPIFWLHHCNIDRLWELWRGMPGHRDPTSTQWRSAVPFLMPDATGTIVTLRTEDVLDTTTLMGGYRYDMIPPAQAPVDEGRMMDTETDADHPELVGANNGPVSLAADVTRTVVTLAPTTETKSFTDASLPDPARVYLSLENITGLGTPGDFDVYVDMPDDAQAPMRIGTMTTFNLARASDPAREHGGGLEQVFDITDLAERLGLTSGTATQLQLRFVRLGLPPAEDDVPDALSDLLPALTTEASVQVGRVGLFYA